MDGDKMRIVLCDDDKAFVQQLCKVLQEYFQEIRTKCPEIAYFYSGETLLADTGAKDIVFLDIEMNGIDGICVGSVLKKENPESIIFIITSYAEYLDEAMRFHVFRYLSKPLDKQRLFRNLKDAISIYMASTVKIAIETKEGIHAVLASKVILVEAQGRKVMIHTVGQDYQSVQNIRYWAETLCEKCFYQTHRSFIVNMEYVDDFDRTVISLCQNRLQAYLTRRKYNDFKAAYLLYLESMRK
jgi:two-component system LytT family response regulator